MLIILALFCADLDLESARIEFLTAAKAKADSITDTPTAQRIRVEMEAFLSDDRKVPSSPHLLALRDKYVAKRALWRARYLESLPESEREATVARWEKEDEPPPLPMRTKWVLPNGAYYANASGKDWAEYTAKGAASFRFQETQRNEGWVELVSRRQGVVYTLRLHDGKAYIRIGDKSPVWEEAFAGQAGKWVE